jgi:hypothetical protein
MRSGRFITEIRKAVGEEHLSELFSQEAVKNAVPGYAEKTYHVFLPKHRKGNPGGNTELFVRVSRGLYRLL